MHEHLAGLVCDKTSLRLLRKGKLWLKNASKGAVITRAASVLVPVLVSAPVPAAAVAAAALLAASLVA